MWEKGFLPGYHQKNEASIKEYSDELKRAMEQKNLQNKLSRENQIAMEKKVLLKPCTLSTIMCILFCIHSMLTHSTSIGGDLGLVPLGSIVRVIWMHTPRTWPLWRHKSTQAGTSETNPTVKVVNHARNHLESSLCSLRHQYAYYMCIVQ